MRTFAGRPQPVEIHHLGIWYSGELLGWRHEADGSVAARVRCVVDGLRHSTWKPLAELRLPDPKRPPRKEGRAAALGRPVAALDEPLAADVFDDRTRPHALRAAPGVRPAKPEHASTPPAPPVPPAARPGPVSPSRMSPPKRRETTVLEPV
jgi:hypothetical protein